MEKANCTSLDKLNFLLYYYLTNPISIQHSLLICYWYLFFSYQRWMKIKIRVMMTIGMMLLLILSQKCVAGQIQKLWTKHNLWPKKHAMLELVRVRYQKCPWENLCRQIRLVKNAPISKNRTSFRKQYLHKINTQYTASDHAQLEEIIAFFQALQSSQLKTITSGHNSHNGPDFKSLKIPMKA